MKSLSKLKALLSVGALTIILIGCAGDSTREVQDSAAKRVTVLTVHSGQVESSERVPGNVRAATEATIEAKIAGRILKLPLKEGDAVNTGQLLIEIDAHEIQAKLDQALASQTQAEQDLKRFSKLLPAGAATSQEYDAAVTRAKVAEAAVAEAKAMASYAHVDAPFDGMVTRKLANEGDLALPGKPLLTLEGRGLFRFEADVPETISAGLSIGAVLQVSLSGAAQIAGTVSEVSPISDASSRTRRVKVDLPADPILRSGQFGYMLVPVNKKPELRVPASAILERGQLESVFVLKDGRINMRLVRSGKRDSQSVEILSGLRDGEQVVIKDPDTLSDGERAEETK